MLSRRSKPSIGATAATGLFTDPLIRRAALEAAPPMAKLGFGVGRRLARRRARRRIAQFSGTVNAIATVLAAYGPLVAQELGLVEPPRRSSRVASKLAATAVIAAGAVYLLDPERGPERRQQVHKLVVH
jgi:hypothetical protein